MRNNNSNENIEKNPAWVVFLHPFTFLIPNDEQPWTPTLEQINQLSYNTGNLARIVSKFTIEGSDLPGIISYDGGIAIPKNSVFPTEREACRFFSDFLTKLLLTNYFVEGIDSRDLAHGFIHDSWALSAFGGNSYITKLHTNIRNIDSGNLDAIHLLNPRILYTDDLIYRVKEGGDILKKIPTLSTKFLIRGITEYQYENWDLTLSNIWISIEQLIDHLWFNVFINSKSMHPEREVLNRKRSLKEDNRTWSMVVKKEILYQNDIISDHILSNLYACRKARNKLVHEGTEISKEVADLIIESVVELLKAVCPGILLETSYLKKNKNALKSLKIRADFTDWKSLPDRDFVENIFGYDRTKKIKKNPLQ